MLWIPVLCRFDPSKGSVIAQQQPWLSLADLTGQAPSDFGPVPSDAATVVVMTQAADGSVEAMLALARHCGIVDLPAGADGGTLRRWELLANVAAQDVSAARVVEAHLDALAILAEAAADGSFPGPGRMALELLGVTETSTWGVFAAEGPGVRVDAVEQPGPGWRLSGVKPWCSLAAVLTHALITAHTTTGGRRLFAIALQDGSVVPTGQAWVARGLQDVPSTSIELSDTPAVPIGGEQWYLDRPGFAWGGAGVAACWFGGAVGVGRHLFDSAQSRPADQITEMHLGAVDVTLTGVRSMLVAAAADIDAGRADGEAGAIMALRVRTAAATCAQDVVQRSAHALGPAPLALDGQHARRVADLQMYIGQHHAERDLVALGRYLQSGDAPW